MNDIKFSEAMSEVDSKYVDEAISYESKRRNVTWLKWGAMVACFALVAVIGVGALLGNWFGVKNDIATLENGNTLSFIKSNAVGGSMSLDMDVTTRALTNEEIHTVFADLPVTANAVFTTADNQLIGFEGTVEGMRMIIATSDVRLLDTTVVGGEETSEVDGISVTAGYFLTDPNSRGQQTAIYYAAFKLANCTVYLENAGTKAERETVKNDLAGLIYRLIANGELDITQF